MRTLRLSLILALALQFSATPSFADQGKNICPLLLGNTPVTVEALQALHDAKSNFKIEVLTKVVDGSSRIVILAGETHIKGEGASKKGLELMKHFPMRGLEGRI